MEESILSFGLSCNPPTVKHREGAIASRKIGPVIVTPCGPRLGDKPSVGDIDPIHRAAMADLNFGDLEGITVDRSDLEKSSFTRTFDLDRDLRRRYRTVYHVIGSDLLPDILTWYRGKELWRNAKFAILDRPDYPLDGQELPLHHILIPAVGIGASREVRRRVFEHESIDGLVTLKVKDYIERQFLYRGRVPTRRIVHLDSLKIKLYFDETNPRACEFAKILEPYVDEENASFIVVLGGDGTLLHTAENVWPLRLPIIAINLGHFGNLTNDIKKGFKPEMLLGDFRLRHAPLLFAEITKLDGSTITAYAFNDARVERSGIEAAWIEVRIKNELGKLWFSRKIQGDGVMAATPAGSTAYQWTTGGRSEFLDASKLLIRASNAKRLSRRYPRRVGGLEIPPDYSVEFVNLDDSSDRRKRLLRAIVGKTVVDEVKSLKVAASKTAGVDLLYLPDYDLSAKILRLQAIDEW